MRRLYQEFFHVPKNGKIREKVMLMRVAMLITITVVCLGAMGFSAYAYFSFDLSSDNNVIKAANFEATLTLTPENEPGQVFNLDSQGKLLSLKKDVAYTVTLEASSESTAQTGFMVIDCEATGTRYHTQQVNRNEVLTFVLTPDADVSLNFASHWGTSSYYGYTDSNPELYLVDGEGTAVRTRIQMQSPAPPASEEEDESTEEESESPLIHVVQSGEFLSLIAKNYGVDLQELIDLNNIENPNLIRRGMELKIPPKKDPAPAAPTSE